MTLVVEARRVTGPGMLWGRPGAMLDVEDARFDPGVVADLWRLHARRVLDAVGWGGEQVLAHPFQGGITLAISAPEDRLYTAVSVAEAAWGLCAAALLDKHPADFASLVPRLREEAEAEANPGLLTLMAAARGRGLEVLVDDEVVTLGHGAGSQGWPVRDLPEGVDWDALHNIPVALITGTNGKTTTTRLCAAIGRAAGFMAGLTSTDMVQIG
ncbi:hypothetical protein, partial [Tabrizicola sp.]|uniref:hypothetical protein n=1 Tax=Tabrizicola sp. TaxID=2005166 RepID=UPI002869FD1F